MAVGAQEVRGVGTDVECMRACGEGGGLGREKLTGGAVLAERERERKGERPGAGWLWAAAGPLLLRLCGREGDERVGWPIGACPRKLFFVLQFLFSIFVFSINNLIQIGPKHFI